MAAAEHAAAASGADALDYYPLLVGKQDNTTSPGTSSRTSGPARTRDGSYRHDRPVRLPARWFWRSA